MIQPTGDANNRVIVASRYTLEEVNPISADAFEREVSKALDLLPDELAELMDNVVVVVEDRNVDEPDLLGLYEGLPHTDRDGYGLFDLPDRVSVYRYPLCEYCDSSAQLIEEIRVTVIHEVAQDRKSNV